MSRLGHAPRIELSLNCIPVQLWIRLYESIPRPLQPHVKNPATNHLQAKHHQ